MYGAQPVAVGELEEPYSGCFEGKDILLKVEGTLYLKDTELLEKICRDIGDRTGCPVTLDLEDIGFLDSESASVLCRMKREQGVKLEGLHLFIAKVVELTEAEEAASKYLPRAANEPGQ